MDHPDVEIIEKTTTHDGFLRVDTYRLRHRKFDGTWTDTLQREVCDRGHAVGVLPYDPVRDEVVLIEQFRVGAAAAGGPAWLTEIVAGMVDEGETPEEVARREATEETGCTLGALEWVGEYFSSPGAFTERVSVFVGRTDCTGIGGIGGKIEEHEDIRVFVVPAAEAIRRLDEGTLNNSVTLIAMAWFARHHDALRARWREG